MHRITQYIIELIRIDFFATFAIFSIIVFVFKLSKWKQETVTQVDNRIVNSIPKIGIIWFVLFISQDIILNLTDSQTNYTPKYRYIVIIQYTIWLFLTQLFRINFIKKNYLIRIFLSLMFFLDFERFDILMIVLSKNGIPDTWIQNGNNMNIFETVFAYKLLFFTVFIKLILYFSINYFLKSIESKKSYRNN